jgi:hypothetical protein
VESRSGNAGFQVEDDIYMFPLESEADFASFLQPDKTLDSGPTICLFQVLSYVITCQLVEGYRNTRNVLS